MPMSLGARTRFLSQIAQTLWLESCHFCGLAFQVGCFLKHIACELGHMSPHAHPFLSSRGILLLPSFSLLCSLRWTLFCPPAPRLYLLVLEMQVCST